MNGCVESVPETNSNQTCRSDGLVVGLLVGLALLLRLQNVEVLKPCVDETSYLFYTRDKTALSLFDLLVLGKFLGVVLLKPIYVLFVNPIYAGKIFVSLFGAATTYFIYHTGATLENRRVGQMAALLYAVAPFAVFTDKQILFDPMATTFAAAAFYCGALGVKNRVSSLHFFIFAGILILLAVVTKLTVASALFWIVGLIVFYPQDLTSRSSRVRPLAVMSLGLIGGILLTAFLLSGEPFHTSNTGSVEQHYRWFVSEKASSITSTLTEFLKLLQTFFEYQGVGFLLLLFACGVALSLRRSRLTLLFFSMTAVSLLSFFAIRIMFGRYIHFIQVPLYLAFACCLDSVFQKRDAALELPSPFWKRNWRQSAAKTLFAIGFILFAVDGIRYVINPYFRIPEKDVNTYLGPGGALGMEEVARALEDIALNSDRKLVVVTSFGGSHGTWTLPMLLRSSKAPILFHRSWISSESEILALKKIAQSSRLLVLQERDFSMFDPLQIAKIGSNQQTIFEFSTPHNPKKYTLIEVLP